MVYKVWHRDNPTFMDDNAAQLASDAFPAGFTHVADITPLTPDFNYADSFFLTNHVDKAWWENDGVVKVVPQQVRSTSVGDVVECPDGSVYMVKGMGWEKIR